MGIHLFVVIFGLAMGSFLNVCIYRFSVLAQSERESETSHNTKDVAERLANNKNAGMSIHTPRRSCCPACREPIKVVDNVPLVSYLLLRGKCRHCHANISAMYPAVELATALLYLGLFSHFGLTLDFVHALLFVTLLIPIAVIDAQHYIIPNGIIGTGMVLGVSLVSLIAYQRGDVGYLLTRLIGAVAGGTLLWLIAVIGGALLRKTAMGGGDVKLMALNGLFLGAWPELAMVLALSAIGGAVVGSVLVLTGRKSRQSPIPYGPFLTAAAVIVLLWGDWLWGRYLQLFVLAQSERIGYAFHYTQLRI